MTERSTPPSDTTYPDSTPAAIIAAVQNRRTRATANELYWGPPIEAHRELDSVNADLDAVLAAAFELLARPAATAAPAETLKQKFDRYVQARGLVFHDDRPGGRKVCEEATELAIEIAAGNIANARLELADVIFAATRQATLLQTTVEACIEEKIAYDTGRESRRASADGLRETFRRSAAFGRTVNRPRSKSRLTNGQRSSAGEDAIE